jgi:radical SAM protein with 4Fe4S-binding SPASM domain
MWMLSDGSDAIGTSEKLRVIEEFYSMNPAGVVVLTGGETMSKMDEFFSLSNKCNELGLASACNTNGSYINEQNIHRILKDGTKYFVISLDSHICETHDYIRGVTGSYDQVTSAISSLVASKKEKYFNSSTEIITNSVICDLNIKFIDNYIEFAQKIGLDGIMFQLLDKTFWNSLEQDQFFEKHSIRAKEEATRVIDGLLSRLTNLPIVRTHKHDFEWMKMYIQNPDFVTEQVCGAYENNIVVDCRGEVQLCFNMKNLLSGNTLGNIRRRTLQELLTSSKASSARSIMKECRKSCGMLNCHRKEVI